MEQASTQTEAVVSGRTDPLHYGLPGRLRRQRLLVPIGPAQLSERAGLANSAVRSVESGHVPQLDTVERIARVLRVSPCALAYGIDQPPLAQDGPLVSVGVGERLRRVREARGLPKKTLATAAGVTRAMLLYIEGGKSVPSVAMVEKIAAALGVDACWLSWGQGSTPTT